MNALGRFAVALAVVVGAMPVLPPTAHAIAHAAPPPGACTNADPALPQVIEEPWAQHMLDPSAVWPHSDGAGVLVAVVDSGVDADHPQLRAPGKVLPGRDFYLVGTLPGNFDCASHGTAVASIIAAAPTPGVGFAGIAPGATILPVRVVERAQVDGGAAEGIDFGVLARGIRYAADQGAKVINLSLSGKVDDPGVRDAVAYAESKDALVVAAVGNTQQGDRPGRPTFPASYPGVLGVGAVDMAGQLLGNSAVGPQVAVVAPGGGVLAASRVGGEQYWTGTSFATPFVSATAALVRAAWPTLTAPQVAQRIRATASSAPGGRGSWQYGAGLVDPYRAVTDQLTAAPPAALPAVTHPLIDQAAARSAAWWQRSGSLARLAGGGAVALAAFGVLFAVVLRRGRRSRWQPRRAAALPAERTLDEPPDEVFLLPPPQSER